MNTFMNNLQNASNYGVTENGGLTHKTTRSAVYDMFALGGAYRKRSDEDCILLFKNAFEENESLALKCLFYLRDCRGGQGERRFFRTCFKWLAQEHPEAAVRNIENLSEYGRWDDVIYACIGTPIEDKALAFIKKQLALDVQCKTPSLLGKWLPSENASASETKRMGNIVREYLGMSHREYRKTLSVLRERINIVERLMSANRWDEIEFDKIPSRAGLIYKNAFSRRDILAKRYEAFIKDENTKVNAKTLFPYEIVAGAVKHSGWGYQFDDISDIDRKTLEKYWNNLENPFEKTNGVSNILCVCDTSRSMTRSEASAPINVAIALSMFCAERAGGAFKDHYISFSSRPQLIKVEGVDFVDKVRRIYRTNLCENTDLIATFEMLRKVAMQSKPEDIPDTIVVLSDMEIDYGSRFRSTDKVYTEMESERIKWENSGLTMPKLVYWNLDARQNNFLDDGPNVTYVSGFSQNTFEGVLKGKTGMSLMMDKLMSERYAAVH
ncbi:MAG: DUF2828 family protein [Ruminococcus sp.]|nr:DUF2828 family protein [Ruminococcus sp.]